MPTNKPLEKSIENVLRKAVEAEGGLCLKWVCPGHRGVPDRMILFPGGIIAFVELKRPGAKVKAGGLQEWWREKIQSFGFPCYEISRKSSRGSGQAAEHGKSDAAVERRGCYTASARCVRRLG